MASKFIQYLRGDQNAPGERKLVQKLDFFILTFWYVVRDSTLSTVSKSMQKPIYKKARF